MHAHVREALRLSAARPAVALGARTAIATVLPLLLARLIGPTAATWASLTGFSVALADNLGIWSNARQGGRRAGLFYVVFPGSGNGDPRTVEEIHTETEKVLRDWGGPERLASCATEPEPEPATANKSTQSQSPPAY